LNLESTAFRPKRITIIGCGGAGKSTLARQLGQITGIPVQHLDSIYWQPNWIPMQDGAWKESVAKLIAKDEWIIDGNYGGTMKERLARSDLIILMDFPTLVCLWRVVIRWLRNRGRVRSDMGQGCPEKIDIEFLKWIYQYRQKSRPQALKMLNEASHAKVVFIHNASDTDRLVQEFAGN
jgi:adenylate kinase family enzyme